MKTIVILLFLNIVVFPVIAQVPRFVSFQGTINQRGQVLDGVVKSVKFVFYNDSEGGAPMYQNTLPVAFAKGLYSTLIGPIPQGVDFSMPLYMGISVDGGSEMQPRTFITPQPYSFYSVQSGQSQQAVYADSAGVAGMAHTVDLNTANVVSRVNSTSGNNVILHYYDQLTSSDGSIEIDTTVANPTKQANLKVKSVPLAGLPKAEFAKGQTIQFDGNNWVPATMNVPPGTVVAFAGDIATAMANGTLDTTEWLPCDGRVLRRQDYPDLANAIGTANGGTGTNFNLPDYRGIFLRGTNNMSPAMGDRKDSLADPEANQRVSINGGNMQNHIGSVELDGIAQHTHNLTPNGSNWKGDLDLANGLGTGASPGFQPVNNWPNGVWQFGTDPSAVARMRTNLNLNAKQETHPKNAYVNWIIKVKP